MVISSMIFLGFLVCYSACVASSKKEVEEVISVEDQSYHF